MTEAQQVGSPDYDPPEAKRDWYRHKQTSDRGWLVRRNFRDAIRYDRGPLVDQCVFNLTDWERIKEQLAPLSAHHIAQICFEADKAFCRALGHIDLAQRQWVDLSERVRVKWIEGGPLKNSPAYPERLKFYLHVKAGL